MAKILSLCDYTGNMVKPWAENGHDCTILDIRTDPRIEPLHPRIRSISTDITQWKPDQKYDLIFAFPPCTDLAVSGARWFQSKGLRRLARAIEIFGACVDIIDDSGSPGFCENPVSVISSHYRKPNFTFQPWEYGDPYTKRTCLWTFGGFTMPPKTPVEPTLGPIIHFMSPGPDRAHKRSITPMGWAQAVYKMYSTCQAQGHNI